MFLGLRTAIYPSADLEASKTWFTALLGVKPYFDEPFYVGFNVAGYELGLVPAGEGAGAGAGEAITYWGVPDADKAIADLLERGATLHHEVTDVGDGIRVGAVREPQGNVVGVIENPQFALPETATVADGPGR
ncbi:MAG TPA: VOC family protein [Acidimicrobiales bacterium]|nr:VOC family protein [Acidimicrobiales bacterium]